ARDVPFRTRSLIAKLRTRVVARSVPFGTWRLIAILRTRLVARWPGTFAAFLSRRRSGLSPPAIALCKQRSDRQKQHHAYARCPASDFCLPCHVVPGVHSTLPALRHSGCACQISYGFAFTSCC